MQKVVILGGGGHAGVVLDVLRLQGFDVIGFLDQDKTKADLDGIPRIGGDEPVILADFPLAEVKLVNGFGSIGDNRLRKSRFLGWKKLGYEFLPIHHPSANIAKNTALGEGAQIMAGAVIQPGSTILENAVVNTAAVVDHGCCIGRHAHVATGAVLSGDVHVGDDAHVGAGAIVLQGVQIGEGSIVGIGSVVVRDVPARTRVMGIPAHKKSKRIDLS